MMMHNLGIIKIIWSLFHRVLPACPKISVHGLGVHGCAWFAFAPANLHGELVHYRQGLFRDLLLLLSTVELWSGKRSVFPGLFLFGKSMVCIWENCTVLDSQNMSSGKGLTRISSTICLRMLNTPKLCQAWC